MYKRQYRYSTVIGNVDLNACAVNDLVDRLSSLSDYITGLVRIDLDLNDLRCECADFFSRLLDCFWPIRNLVSMPIH